MLRVLSKENTLLNRFVAQLRDAKIQADSMRFRRNLERIGEIMAYEISKTLNYKSATVETPLGEAEINLITDEIVLAPVLRSGLPMHTGFLNYFDNAESAFVSAYRHYSKDGTFKIDIESITAPPLVGKILIIIDPMLATGVSVEMAVKNLIQTGGEPDMIHVASVLASEDGIEYIKKHFDREKITLWTVAVDAELTVKSYIVPGIGDTGDLAYGEKV